MKKIVIGVIAVAMLAIPTAAIASVTIDSATGMGFVGKGDVQTPFKWNDNLLQNNASGVTFSYNKHTSDTYEAVCVWYTEQTNVWFEGEGKDKIKHSEVVQVRHDSDKHANVIASVSYDPKSISRTNPNGKVTGFNLTGFDAAFEDSTGTVPVEGDPCPATGNEAGTDNAVDKTIESVTQTSHTATEQLMAHHNTLNLHATLNWPVIEPVATVA